MALVACSEGLAARRSANPDPAPTDWAGRAVNQPIRLSRQWDICQRERWLWQLRRWLQRDVKKLMRVLARQPRKTLSRSWRTVQGKGALQGLSG
jgi:hypothetical protein